MLAVALVDFHDSMMGGGVIDAADAKDATSLIAAYPDADSKLQAIEAEENDGEIKAIRQKLDEICILDKEDKANELSAKAA
jgi:hypothetical protein